MAINEKKKRKVIEKKKSLNNEKSNFRIHICVTMMHTMDGMADKIIKDITAAVGELMKNPEKPVEGKVFNKIFGFYY